MPFELLLVDPEPEPDDCVAVVFGDELVVDELLELDPHAAAVSAASTRKTAAMLRGRILIFRSMIAPVSLDEG